jgi:lysophospholipase L1-like esterase
MRTLRLAALAVLNLLVVSFAPVLADGPFYLKSGDRVVFYGDSITDQRLYTTFTESFVVTRFPKLDVSFIHSGWGGDRVTGGGGGPIDVRLKRDVFAYKPTVMTIMLGMNDASYRAFDEAIFDRYAKGYEHIVESVKSTLPGIRMTLIVPSPFDDVTRKPNFEGGYNAVLLRYGEFVKELAKKNGLDVADLNTSVVEATKKAFETDPSDASKLNPDRVHPGLGGQLLMSAALLRAWNAPALVSSVSIKARSDGAKADAEAATVTDLKSEKDMLSWTQLDEALPFPIDLKDKIVALALKSSDVVKDLDQQPLKVEGLEAGDYTLKIDGKEVGNFSMSQLAEGINLATLPTPMVEQARSVHQWTLKHNNLHFTRWRTIQVPPISNNPTHIENAMDALDAIEADMVKVQRETAQPKPRTFEISKKS